MDDVLKLRGDDAAVGIFFVSSDVDSRSIDFPERVVRAPSNLGEVGARLPHLRPLLHRGSAREGPEVVQDVRREPRVPRVAVALEGSRARGARDVCQLLGGKRKAVVSSVPSDIWKLVFDEFARVWKLGRSDQSFVRALVAAKDAPGP